MKPQQQFEKLSLAPNLDINTRINRLKSLKKVINENTENLIVALNKDFGRRSANETILAEIFTCNEEINHTLKHLKSWTRPRTKMAGLKFLFSKNEIIPQPLGVVGIISPWNYPFNLAIAPLIAAIAAGNRVMIKPSEMTPNTSQLIADMLSTVFNENEVLVSVGDLKVAQEFSRLPFKHLLFTGSTAVGKIIMENASCHLTPVTLELGGKSPVVIEEDYDIGKAAKSIVGGKFFNAGQTCIAPDYILVSSSKVEQLTNAIIEEFNRCYPDITNNSEYTAIINQNHFNRLNSLVADSESSGQCIYPQGKPEPNNDGVFPPVLVVNPQPNSKVMHQEIFGPILPIISVKSVEESIDFINSRDNPLTLYIFSDNKRFKDKVLRETLSGSVAINETLFQFVQQGIPFGGVGQSGMGSYHGLNGFNSFSHLKTVYHQSRINFNHLIRAPFTPLKQKIIKFLRFL